MIYRFLADMTVAIHFAYVAFVVIALPITLVGGFRGWAWVRNRWFRGLHLTMILIVVAESWAGITCPLTTMEKEFRAAAGEQSYRGDFMANCLHDALFFEAQPWVFTLVYSVFAMLVITTWILVPPRWRPPVNQLETPMNPTSQT